MKGDGRWKASDVLPGFAKRPETRATRPPAIIHVDSEMYTGRLSKWDKMAGSMREIMESQNKQGENPQSHENAEIRDLCNGRLWQLRA